MIELTDFSKRYSNKLSPAVEHINIKAENGITGLLGLNGAGKTTIIKAVLGLHYASSGSVRITDNAGGVFDASICPEKVRSVTGYVPETSCLPNNLTVCEYLNFVQELYTPVCHDGSENAAYAEKKKYDFEKTAADWDLSGVLSKKIGELSKGFRQRVSFAQCFIHNPVNIVLDEPVNGLDPAQIIQFRNFIKKISTTRTVLISTHLMQEVHSLCSKIYIVSDGKIAASGTEDEIVRDSCTKNIEEAFLKITGGQKILP